MKYPAKAFLIIFFFTASSVVAQTRHPKHSLAMGIANGSATVSHEELNTAFWKFDLNHQRNFSSWFSLRTSITATYILPVKFRRKLPSPMEEQTSFPEARVTEFSYFQLGLSVMPLIYYRDKNFSLFMGVAGGLGSYFEERNAYTMMWYREAQESREENRRRYPERHLHLGYSPTAGIGFNLGGDRSGGEIEIAVSYDKWQGREGFDYSTGFTSFGLQTSYRYNFER